MQFSRISEVLAFYCRRNLRLKDSFISKRLGQGLVQSLPCNSLCLLPAWSHIFSDYLFKIFASGKDDGTQNSSSGGYIDPRFKRVLWYLIGGTKGGVNRAKIIALLNSRPANPHQIAIELKLDYKTILHHLKVLSDHGLAVTDNKDSYGASYFLTPLMENNFQSFVEILAKIKKRGNAG
jgi:DNA-binding transcriptional ArsR family regulator